MKFRTLSVLAVSLLMSAGAPANQQQLAASILEARGEAGRTADQLKATLTSLNALTRQSTGDLRPAYTEFAAQAAKTEGAAGWTRTRVQWMATDGRQYFDKWQQDLDGIANPSLRKKAQKRLDAAKLSYGKVEGALKQADAKFTPFLSDLGDIQKALANDVTPGGVKAIRGTVKSANFNHQYVSQSISTALKEMDKMAKALSPEAK